MENEKILKYYNPICFLQDKNEQELLVSKKRKLFIYNLERDTFTYIATLNSGRFKHDILGSFKLLTRLLRLTVNYGFQISVNKVLLVFDKQFYELNLKTKKIEKGYKLLRGSRPLSMVSIKGIDGFENQICFGEYFSNRENDEVHIYKRSTPSEWEIVYTFPANTVEHIHALVPDKFNNCVWILTGDFGDAAAIWIAKDNFNQVELVFSGSQKYRACVAFAIGGALLYATDSQFEQNSINIIELKDNNWVVRELTKINGSSIYGCKTENHFVFSTAVEGINEGSLIKKILNSTSGPGILKDESQIIVGNLKEGFRIIKTFKKDIFPFVLFQFGAIRFPTGSNNSSQVVAYSIGSKKNDLDTIIIKIEDNDE